MSEDYPDYHADHCPKCGHSTVTALCNDCGGEGVTQPGELHEQDPLWYDPNDFAYCDECRGRGHFHWCQACGWDLLEHRYLGWPLVKYQPPLPTPNSALK